MICEILCLVLAFYILSKRSKIRAKLKDAESLEIHYPDGSKTYLSERDLL